MAEAEPLPALDLPSLAILGRMARILPAGYLSVSDLGYLSGRRMHPATISSLLLQMERRKLVRRRDEFKPLQWQITEEGRKHV